MIDEDFEMADAGYSETSYPSGIPIEFIRFYPAAADEILVVRNGSSHGPVIFKETATGVASIVNTYNRAFMRPYIDASECSLTTTSKVVILTAKGIL